MFAVRTNREREESGIVKRTAASVDAGQVVQRAATLLERAGLHARVGIFENRFVLTSTNDRGQFVFTPFAHESSEALAERARSVLAASYATFAVTHAG